MSEFEVGDKVVVTSVYSGEGEVKVGMILDVVKETDGYYWITEKEVQLDYIDSHSGYYTFEKIVVLPTTPSLTEPVVGNPKYNREIKPGTFVDVYDVLYAFKVTDPCLQHLIKKALAAGQRGHKDARQDLVDIRDSAQRALDSYDIWNTQSA